VSQPFYAGQAITADALNSIVPQFAALSTAQTISSTSPVPITGFSFSVAAGVTYLGKAWITIDSSLGGGGTAEFRFTGPASPTLLVMGLTSQQTATADAYQNATLDSATGYNSGFISTPMLSAATYIAELTIVVAMSAAGTLALQCANAAGASDSFAIGGYMTLTRVLV
jgi:hypothetical protein